MGLISLHVDGITELQTAFESWKLRVDDASLAWVTEGGEYVADFAKAEFEGGSSAAPWRGPNFPHPTSHSGFLRNSIGTDNVKKFPGGASSETGPRTVYGRRIELGYTGHPLGSTHPAGLWPYFTTRKFPFLRPGGEKATPGLGDMWIKKIVETTEV